MTVNSNISTCNDVSASLVVKQDRQFGIIPPDCYTVAIVLRPHATNEDEGLDLELGCAVGDDLQETLELAKKIARKTLQTALESLSI